MKLANYTILDNFGDKYLVNVGTKQELIDSKVFFQDLVNLSHFLIESRNKEEVECYLKENSIDNKVYDYMVDKHMLIKDTFDIECKNSRNHLFYNLLYNDFESVQSHLDQSRLLIIGCGGIGNFLGTFLTGIGVKELILVDGDTIEEHNLNRQFLFSREDVGEKKADTLKRELGKRNSKILIKSIPEMADYDTLDKIGKSSKIDMIIFCADSRGLVPIVNEFSVKHKIPMLNIGYINDISVIGPIYIPNKSSCLVCSDINCFDEDNSLEEVTKNRISEINNRYKSPSAFINNSFAAAMASMEIINCLSKNYENLMSIEKRIGISNSNFQYLELKALRNTTCKVCGEKYE